MAISTPDPQHMQAQLVFSDTQTLHVPLDAPLILGRGPLLKLTDPRQVYLLNTSDSRVNK